MNPNKLLFQKYPLTYVKGYDIDYISIALAFARS